MARIERLVVAAVGAALYLLMSSPLTFKGL